MPTATAGCIPSGKAFTGAGGNSYTDLVYLLGYEHSVPVYARPERGAKSDNALCKWRSGGHSIRYGAGLVPGRPYPGQAGHPPAIWCACRRFQAGIYSGWLRREDLVAGDWVKQKEQSPLYRFEASGYQGDNGPGHAGDAGRVDAIKIIDKRTGKTRQVIADIGASLESELACALKVVDFNFDGYPDLMLYYQNGGAGPNSSWNFYVYNPLHQQFEYNDTLSALSQVEVDTKTKTISAAWRGGAGMHGAERYQYINGVLTRTYFWEQTFGLGYFASEVTGSLSDGRWQELSLQGAELAAPSVSIYEQAAEQGTARIISKGKDGISIFSHRRGDTIVV